MFTDHKPHQPHGPEAARHVDQVTIDQVLDLVDRHATAARVPRPAVAFLPWLDDGSLVHAVFAPGRRTIPARLDVDRHVLDWSTPAALEHLIAREIGRLKRHHRRSFTVLQYLFPVVADGAFLAGGAWFVLREPSWSVGLRCGALCALMLVLSVCWCLLVELDADRYAAGATELDHDTADEIRDYAEHYGPPIIGGPAELVVDRLRRRWLHGLVDDRSAAVR